MAEPAESPERTCIACGSPIAARASVCPVCKSWQSRWKNYLVLFGGSAGVLALLATAGTYIGNTIYTAASQRHDALVLQLQYPGYQVFDNSGTVPILLSHLDLRWRDGGRAIYGIGQQLPPQQMYYKTDHLVEKLKACYPSAGLFANRSGDGTALLSEASPFPYTDKRYSLMFFSKNSPELTYLESYFAQGKKKLVEATINEAYVYYYSNNNTDLHRREFPAVAAFLELKKKECAKPAAAEREEPPAKGQR